MYYCYFFPSNHRNKRSTKIDRALILPLFEKNWVISSEERHAITTDTSPRNYRQQNNKRVGRLGYSSSHTSNYSVHTMSFLRPLLFFSLRTIAIRDRRRSIGRSFFHCLKKKWVISFEERHAITTDTVKESLQNTITTPKITQMKKYLWGLQHQFHYIFFSRPRQATTSLRFWRLTSDKRKRDKGLQERQQAITTGGRFELMGPSEVRHGSIRWICTNNHSTQPP